MTETSTTSDSTATEDVGRQPVATKHRVESVDLLRGLVMVVMVLDHVRDYFMDVRVDPTDLSVTTPALFFTRWVTHFCAPTFVFLAGMSASLSSARKTKGELSRHLLLRGLWLIVLEQIWDNVFVFSIFPPVVFGLILWAIGWSMIVLAALVYLPRLVIGGIGIAMIVLHNLLDGVTIGGNDSLSLIGSLLHRPGLVVLPGGVPMLAGYPLIPWVGVMAAGYALGPGLTWSSERRRPILGGLGLVCVLAFVSLRFMNVYGDPQPWSSQANPIFTVISFLNCLKYPPSLVFLLMTLGPALLAMAALDRGMGRLGTPVRTIGQVPLFYYLLQWPIAHAMAVGLLLIQGQPIGWMFRFPPLQSPDGYGYSLPIVYLFWAITVALLYYPCRWFADLKRRRRDAWLSYF